MPSELISDKQEEFIDSSTENCFNGNKKIGQKCKVCSGYEDKISPMQISEYILDSCGELRENMVSLSSILDKDWQEILEAEKHEIVVKISDKIGHGPKGLTIAEQLFEEIKYMMARYVIRFEFNKHLPVSTQLALWLDMKLMPDQKKKMEKIINRYFDQER